jgi:hypothetical protein
MPAYWFLYNMYALARNSWKFAARDRRRRKIQRLEFDWLAPDTVNEMFTARRLLEEWAGGPEKGRILLETVDEPVVHAVGMESSHRPVRVLKAGLGWRAYGDLIHWYGMRTLLKMAGGSNVSLPEYASRFSETGRSSWENLGGQLFTVDEVDSLKKNIRTGKFADWHAVHKAYESCGSGYPEKRAEHAWGALTELHGLSRGVELSSIPWDAWLQSALRILDELTENTRESRAKDYDNPFRNVTFDTAEERDAVRGRLDENVFLHQNRRDADRWRDLIYRAREGLGDPT